MASATVALELELALAQFPWPQEGYSRQALMRGVAR